MTAVQFETEAEGDVELWLNSSTPLAVKVVGILDELRLGMDYQRYLVRCFGYHLTFECLSPYQFAVMLVSPSKRLSPYQFAVMLVSRMVRPFPLFHRHRKQTNTRCERLHDAHYTVLASAFQHNADGHFAS